MPPASKDPTEALREAMDLLLESKHVSLSDDDFRRRRYDNWDLIKVEDADGARGVCESLLERYKFAREQEKATPRLTKLRAKIRKIESLSGTLSRVLESLNAPECYAIHVVDDYSGTTQAARLREYYDSLETDDFLPMVGSAGQTDPGLLAQQLGTLSLYMNALDSALGERYGRQGRVKSQLDTPLSVAPSVWRLIDDCWRVFSNLGLEPSGTVDGPLFSFIEAIDFWTTAHHAKVEYYFKKYIPIRQEYEVLYERFQKLRKGSRRYSRSEFDVAMLRKTSGAIPSAILTEAFANDARRSDLEIILSYGPQHWG